MSGAELRRQRERLRITQVGLASAAGMHAKTLGRFERGQGTLSYTSALAIAFVFAVAQGRL